MSQYMPSESKAGLRQLMNLTTTIWYVLHMMIVLIGLAALFSRTSRIVSLTLIVGFIFVVTLLRFVINKGELRYFRRMKSTFFNATLSIVGSVILYGIGPALVPVSLMRFPCALGPTVFGFVWVTSYGISAGIVFFLVKDVYFLAFFGILCFLYVVVVFAFFSMLREKSWTTFLFSTRNWKDTLRDELWDNVEYGSTIWKNHGLHGDEGAHYAGLINSFLADDLPWDKLSVWLNENKEDFLYEPPIWLSNEWLLLIPKRIRDKVWTVDEFRHLQDSIEQLEGQDRFNSFKSSRRFLKSKICDSQNEKKKEEMKFFINQNSSEMKSKNRMPKPSVKVHPVNKTHDMENASSLRIEARGKVLLDLDRRRSSVMESFRGFLPKMNEDSKHWSDNIDIPLALQSLLNSDQVHSSTGINQLVANALQKDFARSIIETRNPQIHNNVPALIIGALIKHIRKDDNKRNTNINMMRLVLSCFFEIVDEISDIVLAIMFAYSSADLHWAAVLMFVFMGLNRGVNMLNSFIQGEPMSQQLLSLLSVKCITDTYQIMTQGEDAYSGRVSLMIIRSMSLTIGVVFESLPQMVLQLVIVLSEMKNSELDQGILAAQIMSIIASCLSIGLSFASQGINQGISQRHSHPSISEWIPIDDGFRETFLFISLTIWGALHVFLAVCGTSIFFAFTDAVISLPIIFGLFFVFNTMRYVINDSGWRGLGGFSVKSVAMDIFTFPIMCILYFVMSLFIPFVSWRYQCVVGPFLFTYGVVSSFIFSLVSIYIYVEDTSTRILFGSLSTLYILTVCIFLANIDEKLTSFLFSTVNWKQTLRDELWDIAHHCSDFWDIPELIGDHDANHAAMIRLYKNSDLPWEKIKRWLKRNKAAFLRKPPLWMTPSWFDFLTPQVKEYVWEEPGELEELIAKVKEVCQNALEQAEVNAA